MAPIKFEENIKDKLEKRTIEPSDLAWNKLSDKLDAQKGRSNNRKYWWLGIAASIVGVFLVSTLFFNKSEEETVQQIIVETPINEIIKAQEKLPIENAVVENEESSKNEESKRQKEAVINTVKKEGKRKTFTKTNKSIKPKTEIVANKVLEEEVIRNEDLSTINNQEIIAQIPELEKDKVLVTDAEIELLLQGAQKDLVTNKIKTESAKTVDANLLLQDVETDLEKSFRDKVFNTIITGYNTVKTAVVERND